MRAVQKPQSRFLLLLTFAVLLVLPFETSAQDSSNSADQHAQAAADRASAAKLRADAANWREMAAKAEARAAGATNQSLKDVWTQNATQERAQADQLAEQAKQLEDRADADAASAGKERAQTAPPAPAPPMPQAASEPQPASAPSLAPSPPPQAASAPSPPPQPASATTSSESSPAPGSTTTSTASSGPTAPPLSGASPYTESPIEQREIVGRWRNTADHSIVEIKELYPGENKTGITFKGKHDSWGGIFTRGSGDKPSHLSFQMDPKFSEMNPNAPDWARQSVDGQLRWFLELDAQGCGPALSGKWYRGEIKWTEPGRGGGAKQASAASHVRDVPVEFEKTSEKPEFDGQPTIRVRSALRKLPFTTADSLYRDEPFFVDVILPENEAKKAGMDLTVTFHSALGDDSTTLGLSSYSTDVRRFAVYTMLDPVTMAHGGAGAHHGMLAHLSSQFLKKVMPGNMSPLTIVNGDTITVSYGDTRTSFTAYAQPVYQDVARVEASLRQLEVGFAAGLANADADSAHALTMKLRMIKNALLIINDELTIRDGVHNPYEAYSTGAAYLAMLTDGAAWKPPEPGARPAGLWDPLLPSGKLVEDHRFPGVGYYSNFERRKVDDALSKGQAAALKLVERGLDSAGLAAVQFFISSTGADQFAIIAFGVDMNGQPVDAMTRFTTGLTFGAHLILRGTSLAQQVQGEMVEAEQRAARYAGTKAADAATAEEKAIGAVAARGSNIAAGGSRLAATGIPAQVIIGAERDLEKVKLPTNLEFTLPGAKTITDRFRKAVRFLLQEFDDTCGVVVGETMARDGGADHLTEAQAMTKAYRDARKAYRAGEGMNVTGMRRYLKSRGAQTAAYTSGVTIAQIEAELAQGGQVAVMINTASPGKEPFCHWVRVMKIERGANGWPDSVIYGDPWTGTECRAASCVFRSSMIDPDVRGGQFGVVFATW